MKYLRNVILLIFICLPILVFAKPVESELSSINGIIKKFNVGRISIENVGYTRYSNLLSSGVSGVTIKGALYNSYARDVKLEITLKVYNKNQEPLQEFISDVAVDENGKATYQQNIYSNEISYSLDDIKYYSLTAELGTDVEILEKGENDVYYLEDYFVRVNVNDNNVFNVEESFLATFRNKIVEVKSKIPFRHVYVRDDGTKVNKRAIISNIDTDDYYNLTTEEGLRVLTIGKEDKTNTKKNYYLTYDYNVGVDTLNDNDEFVFYLISNYDVKVDGLSFEIVMPKEFDKDNIEFVDQYGTEVKNVDYEVNGNVITGAIDGIINPQVAYAIRIKLDDNYFGKCTNNISNLLIASIFVPIVFVILTLLFWFIEKKQRNKVYKGNMYFNKNINALELSYLYNGKVKDHDIPSLLFNLANEGYIEIEKLKKGYKIIKKRDYKGIDRVEKIFMNELFDDGDILYRKDLSISLYSIKEMINSKLSDDKRKKKIYSDSFINRKIIYWIMILIILAMNIINLLIEYQPSVIMFNITVSAIGYIILLYSLFKKKSIMEKMLYTLVALIFIVIPIVLTSYKAFLVDMTYDIVYIVGIICMLIIISVAGLMSDRTRYGRYIFTKIESYKNYLMKLDKDIIVREYKKNKNLLYDILPNAFVLGTSDKIMELFKDIVVDGPEWYKCQDFKTDEFYDDFKNIYSDIFIALKSSKK